MVVNDWHKGQYVFSLLDCVEAIQDEFEFYQSMPSFLVEDRWYKKENASSKTSNQVAKQQYGNLAVCLIDYRVPLQQVMGSHHGCSTSSS